MPKRDDLITPDTFYEITSGGIQKKGEPVPALFISKTAAVEAYERAFLDFLQNNEATFWRMMEAPVADKWMITVTDSKGLHRIAEERWSVTAKIGTWLTTAKPVEAVS